MLSLEDSVRTGNVKERHALVLTLALALASCKGEVKEKPQQAAAAPAPADAAAPLDDLLHFTDARIGVSSKVDNPRDLAEHVADGRLDTAWNGKTNDLVGGWLGFRVPSAARVRVIELTVGYVAKSKTGEDLFAANHRISRVRLTRDGESLGEHAFDPESRDFQRIALDAPGGDFKLEVLETKPGSRATWKELVVSELRVFGVAGAAKRATAGIPRVSVGGFDAPPPAPGASSLPAGKLVKITAVGRPEEECKTWLAPLRKEWSDVLDGGLNTHGGFEPPPPRCGSLVRNTRGDVKLVEIERSDLDGNWNEAGIQRGARTFIVAKFGDHSHYDPGCSGYSGGKMHSARFEDAAAVFEIYRYEVSNPFPEVLPDGGLGEGSKGYTERSLEEVRCALPDDGSEPTCATKMLAKKRGPYDWNGTNIAEGPAPLPW
jgi:hypothetical protein